MHTCAFLINFSSCKHQIVSSCNDLWNYTNETTFVAILSIKLGATTKPTKVLTFTLKQQNYHKQY